MFGSYLFFTTTIQRGIVGVPCGSAGQGSGIVTAVAQVTSMAWV